MRITREITLKKSLAVVATIALTGVLAVTAAGCSNKSRNLASLASNWYYDSSFKRIQPTFTEDTAEELTYTVKQTEESKNATYKIAYADGTYKTKFYAKKITAAELESITLENWRDDYTKALGSGGYMYLYCYTTELDIPKVTYTFGDKTEVFTDQKVVSESYFRSVEDRLSPVYSLKTVKRAVPRELQASSISDCYSTVDMTYESFYTLSGGNVKTVITDNGAENKTSEHTVNGLNGYTNSVFDAAYIDVMARAMRNITSFSQTVSIYSPGIEIRNYSVTSGNASLCDKAEDTEAQLAAIQGVLEGKSLFTPKAIENSEEKTKLKTTSVGIAYNGGSYSGVSQTYWFAVGDGNNETRTLMVKYREPLTYNLGRLDYVLTSIDNFPV